ncbi:MAG TPA: nucleotidyl transferase AbiEii/AbiGii toxin family protein [Actinomycetota bacterium]
MIRTQQIIRQADRDRVDPKTVERDYVLAHCLASIARLPEAEYMVFKGGTALRMCHFDEYRYSADLDFSLLGISRSNALTAIEGAVDGLKDALDFPSLSVETTGHTRIFYEGPLGAKRRWIKLDLDETELILSSEVRPMLSRYADIPQGRSILTYSLEEIGAEKLRCVIQRLQCRDFFDLHFLFEEREVSLDEVWPMFEEKTRHKALDPATFFARFDARILEYEARWESEMSEHLPGELPHFEALLRQLRRRLRPYR